MKRLTTVKDVLKNNEFTTKILLYFSTKTASTDYDTYEKNFTYTLQNPLTIKGIVREIDAESLVWRQMGTREMGAKEILCDEKYADWFRRCDKITIDGDTYQVYKEHVGGNMIIQKRPANLIRVVVGKK